MKKRKWILPVSVAVGVIVLLALAFFIFAAVMTSKGYGMSIGRALYAKDGSCMIVVDENSPIVMSDRSDDGNLFRKISTGDIILVIHSGIEESYPAHTGAYWLMKLGEGDRHDIPDKVIDTLCGMGWLSHLHSDDFSFSLMFGTYGESFYDSESGELVKTTFAKNPSKYVTEYHMNEDEFDAVLNMIWAMDISSYPDKYDPINPPDAQVKIQSQPYMKLVLTYRAGDYIKIITCDEVAFAAGGYDEKAEAFLELCEYIKSIVVNSDEWNSLPESEVIHE